MLNRGLLTELIQLSESCDSPLLADLVKEFSHSSPKLIKLLEQGLYQNNPSMIEEAAHKLKSSSGALGLTLLSEASNRIMEAARRGSVAGMEHEIASMGILHSQQMLDLADFLNQYQAKKIS